MAVNFTWNIFHAGTSGTGTTNNKYTQAQLASVMGTTTAGTTGANIAIGLNQRAVRPPGFTYYYTTTGTGAQWHAKVVEGIGSWRMPLLVPVRPHEPGASYRLTSWPTAISAVHWIMIRGYNGAWDGSRTPLVYYNDSSAGYWGGTGSYSDPSYDVHYVNALNTGKLVW